jgi:hypothetical protein
MMYQVKRSDRNQVHSSPIENIQDALKELMLNPPLQQVEFIVNNEWVFKSPTQKMTKRDVRKTLLHLQNYIEVLVS